MKAGLFLSLVAALLLAFPGAAAVAWGPQGHAAIGQAAVAQVSPRTRARLLDILDLDSPVDLDAAIAEACFWPDTLRDEPGWEWSRVLHYVNIPRDADRYDPVRDCADGLCVTEAIPKYAAELDRGGPGGSEPPARPRDPSWQAFAWVCHLVADLHQPLHAGFADDRGGNEFEVKYRGERLNLHQFWDSVLAADRLGENPSWQPAVDHADRLHGPAVWDPAAVVRWTGEAHGLAIAAAYPPGRVIGDAFADASWAVIREQWSKASERLALILDSVLADPAP